MIRSTPGTLHYSLVAAIAAAVLLGTATTPLTGQAPQGAPPAPGQQSPSFRAGVDVVSLNVTVTDGTARYVTDLEAEDFSVFEDGVKQDVMLFNRTNLPIALALLLDTSASMETRLPSRRKRPSASRGVCGRRISPRSSTSTAGSSSCSPSPTAQPSSSRRFARPRPAAPRRCTTPSTSR